VHQNDNPHLLSLLDFLFQLIDCIPQTPRLIFPAFLLILKLLQGEAS
jgi:hypothetical protein